MQEKIEMLKKLLEELATASEIVDRITITIKPREIAKEEKQDESKNK